MYLCLASANLARESEAGVGTAVALRLLEQSGSESLIASLCHLPVPLYSSES